MLAPLLHKFFLGLFYCYEFIPVSEEYILYKKQQYGFTYLLFVCLGYTW